MYHPEVIKFFDNEMDKVVKWYNTQNPLLANMKPIDMLELGGRWEKILNKFIENCIAGNFA